MMKIIIISVIALILTGGAMVFFIIFTAFGGDDISIVSAKHETSDGVDTVLNYVSAASEMGVDWSIVYLADLYAGFNNANGTINLNSYPILSTLEFLNLRVSVYHWEVIGYEPVETEPAEEEPVQIPVYDWVYQYSDVHKGKTEILDFLELAENNLTPENLDEKISEVLDDLSSSNYSYNSNGFTANTNYKNILTTIFNFSDIDADYIISIYNSGYIYETFSDETLILIDDILNTYGLER